MKHTKKIFIEELLTNIGGYFFVTFLQLPCQLQEVLYLLPVVVGNFLSITSIYTYSLWVAVKLNPKISPRRVLDMLYPIFCFQQAFWLNIRQSMSPLNNIYISRRIFLRRKLKNRVKIKKSVKIKNWGMKFFGFYFIFFGSNDKK